MICVRITRHTEMSAEQATALQNALTKISGEAGPHQIVAHTETVGNAGDVLTLAADAGAGVVEAVLPPAILADLTNPRINTSGLPIIRARMNREMINGEAIFTFSAYERVLKVEVVTEEL